MSDPNVVTNSFNRLGSIVIVAAALFFAGGTAHADLSPAGTRHETASMMPSPELVFSSFCVPGSDVDFLRCR